MIRILLVLGSRMERPPALIVAPGGSGEGAAPVESGLSLEESLQATVDHWLSGNSPSFVLPRGVGAVVFDDKKCEVLATIPAERE